MKIITTIRLDQKESEIISNVLSLLGETLKTMKNYDLECIEPNNTYTVTRNDILCAFNILDNFSALCSNNE